MENLKMRTPDIAEENFKKLAALFPNAVTETITGYDENGKAIIERAIDADVLMQEISAAVVEGAQERYQFTWPDKKKSMTLANQPITKTLRLVREKSVGRDGTPGSIDTENIYIEGDNLDALKLLQETYLGQVKMIYIDPPYNTGSDFIYEDDFSQDRDEYLTDSGQFDEDGGRMVQNLESNGRFHTDWLNMIYPRLRIAKDFLSDDGVIFISIDDNEVENLKKICNEIFGAENFVMLISWEKRYTRNNDAKLVSTVIDYIVCYRKSNALKILREPRTEKADSIYSNPDNDPRGVWTSVSYVGQRTKEERPNLTYEIINPFTNQPSIHPVNAWKYSKIQCEKHVKENRLYWGNDGKNSYPRLKRFLSEMDNGMVPVNLWKYSEVGSLDEGTKAVNELLGKDIFTYPKPYTLIKKMLEITSNSDSIVMDFFSGSATTAHAVMKLNAEDGGKRKFILVQLPEATPEKSEAHKAGYKNICEIGEERIRRAGKKIREESPVTTGDLDTGFRVFRVDSSNMENVYYTPNEFKQNHLGLCTYEVVEIFFYLNKHHCKLLSYLKKYLFSVFIKLYII